ncbi:MAG TPA: hypothetical protein VMW48_18460 [Vicinamibacterales bacterium]|nr:hypothetical protein [Vicinamibacterales bacterium]
MKALPTGRVVGVALALALACLVPAQAVDVHLDRDAIDEAIVFARQATRPERAAFHDGYLRSPGDQVRRVSIVTEYRRVVLLVEEKMRVLDRNYGVRQMTEAIAPYRGLVEVIVELQFHPQNTYVRVPLVDVLLVPLDEPGSAMPLVADATDRQPRFGLFWEPTPADAPWWPFPPPSTPVLGGTEPLTGGWVHARFDATGVTRGRYEVAVKNGAESLGRVLFDFGAIR